MNTSILIFNNFIIVLNLINIHFCNNPIDLHVYGQLSCPFILLSHLLRGSWFCKLYGTVKNIRITEYLFYFLFCGTCVVEWNTNDIQLLLNQIISVMPNDDNVKYSTMAEKLEWDKVQVGSYTSAECKDQWLHISTKVLLFF